MTAPHIEVSGLTIEAGGRAIVNDVSFAIPRGQVTALIGESGSGKTTTALALMGHTRPGARISGGMIRIGDTRIDQLGEAGLTALRGRRVSYIAQSAAAAFNPSRTIMAQVIEPLLVHGLAGRKEAEVKAIALFRALALPSPESIGARYPHQLSGGQLQRLMAAMALITDPELVILDEPTTALDVTTQVDVLKLFKAAIAKSGASAIYVSHDLAVVAQMADRIAVLRYGVLHEEGPARTVLETPRDHYTRTLIAAARPVERPVAPETAGASAPLLSVEGVTAGYGAVRDGVPAVPVLRDVSFVLAPGATLGVIGESGSGKSTLARVIAGLLPRAEGSVHFGGVGLPAGLKGRSREQFRRVQLVFQNADTALNPAHSVATILSRPLAFYHGLKGAAARARVEELLDLIHLPRDIAGRPVRGLSGGQKQRINLARALAAGPDLLLCDEVTSALDTVVGAAILELIDDLRRRLGIATVFISHDISTVRAFCDQVLVLYGGRVVEQGSREGFASGRHHPYTRLLMDSVPEMHPGWLEHTGEGRAPALPGAPVGEELCRFLPRCPVAIAGRCDRTPAPLHRERDRQWLCHHDAAALAMKETV
ncbi:ABC transporter ATP-binding protein [Novosphingobium naphthalenivorans]|uniref:ABC transporter ATP-binding protein n=1 Tax=Novosphingobium naphthalenivorans TaxID=273168 RepID=UPI00082FA9E0|nr:ABC transporter ATP-binding protein [Novosphingobium naphthalenivorans]